jgi:hypothetical protein
MANATSWGRKSPSARRARPRVASPSTNPQVTPPPLTALWPKVHCRVDEEALNKINYLGGTCGSVIRAVFEKLSGRGTLGVDVASCFASWIDSPPITTSDAFTPDSVVGRRSSDMARPHVNWRISITSPGDPAVPDSFRRRLPRNQEFATDTVAMAALRRQKSTAGVAWRCSMEEITFGTICSSISLCGWCPALSPVASAKSGSRVSN